MTCSDHSSEALTHVRHFLPGGDHFKTPADPDPSAELRKQMDVFDCKTRDTRRCVLWLVGLGVRVISITQYSHIAQTQIVVASGARLRHVEGHHVEYFGTSVHGGQRVGAFGLEYSGCVIRWHEERIEA